MSLGCQLGPSEKMSLWRCCAYLGLAALFLTACTSPSPGPTTAREAAPTLSPALASGTTPSPTATPNAPTGDFPNEDFDRKASEYLAKLVQDISPRESATGQELQAARYLAKEFESFGYSTKVHEFNVAMVTPESSSLAVVPPPAEPIAVVPLRGSAVAEGTGPLMMLGWPEPECCRRLPSPEESLWFSGEKSHFKPKSKQ